MLFDSDVPDADLGYRNIRAAKGETQKAIKDELEGLWAQYEPFADAQFPGNFARDPNSRFWEMYLTVELLNAGKSIRPRTNVNKTDRDHGPDICIEEGNRRIWIEAICPETGTASNLDRVPDLVPISEGGMATIAPRREVELRVSSAVFDKTKQIRKYLEEGIVKSSDVCIIAISGANFVEQSFTSGIPVAATAVYPIGSRYAVFGAGGQEIVDSGYETSISIDRTNKLSIPRYAFLDDRFSSIAGLIWSRRSIGNFCWYENDFAFVHNIAAKNPLARAWAPWHEEYTASESSGIVELKLATP